MIMAAMAAVATVAVVLGINVVMVIGSKSLLKILHFIQSLMLKKMQLKFRSRNHTELKQTQCTQIKAEIKQNSINLQQHMRSLVIKIKEGNMTMVVPKLLEKAAETKIEEVEVEVEVEEGGSMDSHTVEKVKILVKQSKLLLKISIMVQRLPKLQ